GGMASVTYGPRRGVTAGAFAFDTGPGVAVIDAITRRVDPDATFDQDGERARHGRPAAKLLEELLTDPYFGQPPPKSTGRERFGIEYADKLLARVKKAGEQLIRILRSEEHTSELQSRRDLVCRLLLEKKKKNTNIP